MTNTQRQMTARQAADPNYDAYAIAAAGFARAEALSVRADQASRTAAIQGALRSEATR